MFRRVIAQTRKNTIRQTRSFATTSASARPQRDPRILQHPDTFSANRVPVTGSHSLAAQHIRRTRRRLLHGSRPSPKSSMDVQLYVYDLSQGLARQMSRQFLGIHIDAVYHTSLVFGGIEYFFGAGVQTWHSPGSTHHGRPMEIIDLGKTELPLDVILEYLETLKETYTAESYDLFMHNCNNFTHDFSMFLLGKGIPPHITSLPETVLQTPFGQMLRPQLDRAMRTVTQAPVPSPSAANVQGNVVRKAVASAATQSQTKNTTSPQTHHPHSSLPLPLFKKLPSTPIMMNKIPPVGKLSAKMSEGLPASSPALDSAIDFITARQNNISNESPLPDMVAVGAFLRSAVDKLPVELLFTAFDLTRILLIDARISGFFAEESDLLTIRTLLERGVLVSESEAYSEGVDKLRLTMAQMCCNLFTSPLMGRSVLEHDTLPAVMVGVLSSGVMEGSYPALRAAAASAARNLAGAAGTAGIHKAGSTSTLPNRSLDQGLAVELAAALIEAIGMEEESVEAARHMAVALARLVYCKSPDEAGEVSELCQAMNAADVVASKADMAGISREDKQLMKEIKTLVGSRLS